MRGKKSKVRYNVHWEKILADGPAILEHQDTVSCVRVRVARATD